jgi:hypothetical protein
VRSSRLALALLFSAAGPALHRAHAGFDLFRNLWGDVLVATDTTPAGLEQTPPTKEEPVYYQGVSLGRRLGSVRGDKEPSERQLNRFAADILAKQGFLDARTAGKEPTLLLVLQWGYLTPGTDDLYWFLGYKSVNDIAAQNQINFIGPEAFLMNFRSGVTERIIEDARHPIYGIMITAFEFKSSRTKQPIAYWQTRIGLPTHGKSMADALPVMLVAAGPSIGRPADKPVLADADSARKGSVNLGELKFLDPMPPLHNEPPAKPETKK